MKKSNLLLGISVTGFTMGLAFGCHKEVVSSGTPILSYSFTEEFEDFSKLSDRGWVAIDNTPSTGTGNSAPWQQGAVGKDKSGQIIGLKAYSYTNSPREYALSNANYFDPNPSDSVYSASSWLISPIMTVKNGDKFSFYTAGFYDLRIISRLQVLLDSTTSAYVGADVNSAGDFKTVLFDINKDQVPTAYPLNWTKFEYVFKGLPGPVNTRIAFRNYLHNSTFSGSVALDQFKFFAY